MDQKDQRSPKGAHPGFSGPEDQLINQKGVYKMKQGIGEMVPGGIQPIKPIIQAQRKEG
jgi:hypothetical protein